jgi:hypothetical protein
MGDDGVWVFDSDPDEDDIKKTVSELGFKLNADKTLYREGGCHFLQRLHEMSYAPDGLARGVRSLQRTLNRIIRRERMPRPGWNPWLEATRALMQLENCAWHPQIGELIAFVAAGYPLLSSYPPEEIFRRAGGATVIEEALEITAFPYGRPDPRKVNEFRILGHMR